jgi:hypothetical protein
MTRKLMWFVAVAAVVMTADTAPAAAGGMDRAGAPAADRATELRFEAEQMFSQRSQWHRAAQLLEQSAQLRPAGDADAYSCLVMAGRLHSAVADHRAARRSYEKAAEQALARGALVEAAHAYVDAAHAAAAARQPVAARGLLERASLLTASPLLSARQVEQISLRLAA